MSLATSRLTSGLSSLGLPRAWSWDTISNLVIDRGTQILVTVILAVVVRWLIHRSIDGLVNSLLTRKQSTTESGSIAVIDPVPTMQLPVMRRQARRAARALSKSGLVDTERQQQRVRTIGSVLRSIATVVVWTIALLMIGTDLGLNMGPVLASAGVGGVALGFGAQSLVKDFLSGIFMILEDQYGVGDIVDTGEVVGTVEEVTLRVTRVRDMSGVVWYVRNGEIVRIANKSQGWQMATIDIPVSIEEDPGRVTRVLDDVVAGIDADPHWSSSLLETPTVAGVEAMAGGTMTIRILAKCAPNEHWGIQREIRERAKTALAKAGVRGPIIVPVGYGLDVPQAAPRKPANPGGGPGTTGSGGAEGP